MSLLVMMVLAAGTQVPPVAQEESGHRLPSLSPAVAAGLRFLADTRMADGGWPAPQFSQHDRFCETAFAGLAFAAAGDRVDGGRFHPALRDAVGFLLDRIPQQGPIRVDATSHRRYESFECWYVAFGMLLLAEAHAQSPTSDTAQALHRLHARLEFLQKRDGGWCHDLDPRVRELPGIGRAEYSEDLAAAGYWCVAAMTAAGRAGVPADPEVLRRGREWLLRLCNSDGGVAYGLGHTWPGAVHSEPGRSAGMLWAMMPHLGRTHPVIRSAASYLDRTFAYLPCSAGHGGKEFLVSHAAGAFACRTFGDDAVARYLARWRPELERRQRDDGRFVMGNGAWDTPVNNTAFALLALLAGETTLRCVSPTTPPEPVRNGVAWLFRQRCDDGSWHGTWGERRMDLALTSLAVRAIISADPLGGPFAAESSGHWLIAEVQTLAHTGFVDRRRSHLGFQLPLVLQALVLDTSPAARAAAGAVIEELARQQRADGGFGYDAGQLYTLCVATIGVVHALLDARAAAIDVPQDTLDRALDYLEACQGDGGGFRYCPDPSHPILAKDRPRYLAEELGRSLGAVAAMVRGGRGESDHARRGAAYIERVLTPARLPADDRYLWFTLVASLGVEPALTADTRRLLASIVQDRIRELQHPDGACDWPGMNYCALFSRPPMHLPYAAAAATLLATRYPNE